VAAARETTQLLRREIDEAREQLVTAHSEAAAAIEARNQTEQRLNEQRRLLEDAQAKLLESFNSLATQALRSNNESFLQLAGAKLEPVQESLRQLTEHIGSIEQARNRAYGALTEQVGQLRAEASNLANALRTPAARGRWGEIQLKRVVELAGMLNHCDFYEQESHAGDDGGRLRPDMRIQLPGGRNIVVDAKVPLSAFIESFEASGEEARLARLREHARRVREHMIVLSARAYWERLQPTPEFVVMFLPGETFYSAALEQDPTLIEQGVDRRVIIATPTTLIALLRAVAYGWRQERLAESAEQISRLGQELHERIATMTGHLNELGGALDRAVRKFNDAAGSMESRVLVSARSLRQMGVASKTEIEALKPLERLSRSLAQSDKP
jgi:DNA recombination protein RmuC